MSDPRENAVDKAARLGLDLVQPKDDEIFVDLDGKAELGEFRNRWLDFVKVYKTATVQYTESSGGNTHAYVTVPGEVFTMSERIALNAALGSDPLREMIAISHHKGGYEYPCVFFERPGTVRLDEPAGGATF